MINRTVLVCLAACVAVVGFAKDAVWTRIDTASGYWTNVVEWVDGEQKALAEYPNGADWDVSLTPLKSSAGHEFTLYLGDSDSISTGGTENQPHVYRVGSLSGSSRHILNLYSYHSLLHNPVYFTVDNPTGFYGFWTAHNPRAVLVVPVANGETRSVRHFSCERRAAIDVQTAGGTVEAHEIFGNGCLEKYGDGELVVNTTSGYRNNVNVNGGRLTLSGSGSPTAPVGEPYLWLDASVPGSLMTTVDGDRQAVTNWVDRRGPASGRPSATVPVNFNPNGYDYLVSFMRAPFLSSETVNGHALVDFGARLADEVAALGRRTVRFTCRPV